MQKNKEIMNKIKECFNLYNIYLVDKDFLIIYNSKNEYHNLKLQFRKEHFLHLTGIENIKPLKFYEKLRDKTLKVNDIKAGKYSNIKLSIFPEMINIFKQNSKIGTYDTNNKYHKNLSIDKGMTLTVPESNTVLGIRFIKKEQAVPVSLLKQKLEKISKKETITEVICMFEKSKEEKIYSKLIYNTTDIQILLQNRNIQEILGKEFLNNINSLEIK